MGNNLAEQHMNNNKAKTKQQTQEQLSSPLSQVLKTYDFGNLENCEPKLRLFDLSSTSILICTTRVEIYTKEPSPSCSFMYLWYIVILIQSLLKEIFLFKWGLIGDVVGFFIHSTAG